MIKEIDTEGLIKLLIPDSSPNAQQFRLFFYELLIKSAFIPDDLSDIPQWPLLDWPASNITNDQLQLALIECKKQLLDSVPVTAYLASLSLTASTSGEEKAFQWASTNAYVLMLLAHIGGHDSSIALLCLRFRLAHQTTGKYVWFWDQLPVINTDFAQLTQSLEQLENTIKRNEITSISSFPPYSSERIAEIRRIFNSAINLKDKIIRQRSSSNESTIRNLLVERNILNAAGHDLVLHSLSFTNSPISDIDKREQRHDQQTEMIVDNYFIPPPGTENSANLQSLVMSFQVAHIKKQQFEFPTSPKVLTLTRYQQIFQTAYNELAKGNVVSSCILLSMLTGRRAETFLNISELLKHKKILQDKLSGQYFWIISLDISDLKKFDIKDQMINQQKSLSLPLPKTLIETLLAHDPINKSELMHCVHSIKDKLKLPVLSLDRISSALYQLIKNYTADAHLADLLTGVTPQHSPALYYCSHQSTKLYDIYKNSIELLAKKINAEHGFNTSYLELAQNQIVQQCIGSQVTPAPNLVKSFFYHLHAFVIQQDEPFQQFNAYTVWMWHIVLLLTSCRPVDHTPGILNQIDLTTNFIWLSDKEARISSSSGRFIPMCQFLINALKHYLVYLKAFQAKYGLLNAETFNLLKDIFASEKPLLYVYTQQKTWQAVTPSHIKTFLHDIFPMPLNWTRHFGRYYLQDKLPVHVIDAIFAHEQPDQEILNPYSSLSLQDLLPAAEIYQQMTHDLALEEVKIHVC